MITEFKKIRLAAGHTQKEAAKLIYASERTVRAIEAGKEDKARVELYKLKLEKSGMHVRAKVEGKHGRISSEGEK